MCKLIFGCGYLGQRVADAWRKSGATVYAATRSAERGRLLGQSGLKALIADVLEPSTLIDLPQVTTVLFAIGHNDSVQSEPLEQVCTRALRNTLDALPPSVQRFLFVSSTGVYGQSDGSWVDEESACQPAREGGRACLAAEGVLHQHPLGARSVILRLAGLYGPGRIPHLDQLRSGRPVQVAADGLVNLIHVDDAVQTILAAERHAPLGSLFLVSDGHPVRRRDFYAHLADQLGVAAVLEPPPAGSHRAQRAASSKRVSNRQMLDQLHVRLSFPSYREGLHALVSQGKVEG